MAISITKALKEKAQTSFKNYSSRGGANRNGISIVNSKGNGKRIQVTKSLLQSLGNPNKIQFYISDNKNKLYIGCNLDESLDTFSVNIENPVIYNGGLVLGLTEAYSLSFGEINTETGKSHVSSSFEGVVETTEEGQTVVAIDMTQKKVNNDSVADSE